MSWLSDLIDSKSGASNAIDIEAQKGRYDSAMKGTNDGYSKMMGFAENQMDINSEQNRARLSMMESSSADNAAESARLAQRGAASAGGAPAAAMAFQQQDMAQKGQANVMNQYQQGMFNQQENAMQSMSGILANQGQIAQSGFNMGESAREYNKKVAAQAQQKKLAMLGGALKIGGGIMSGNPMAALSGASDFMQEGGPVGYNTGGEVEDPENPKPVGNGESDKDSMLKLAMQELRQGIEMAKTEPSPFNEPLWYGREDANKYGTENVTMPLDKRLQLGSAYRPQRENIPVTPQGPITDSFKTRGYQTGGMPKYSPYPGDQIDAKLEPGEYVLNRNAVNAVGKENLDELNNEQAPRFDKGKVKLRMGGYLYGK